MQMNMQMSRRIGRGGRQRGRGWEGMSICYMRLSPSKYQTASLVKSKPLLIVIPAIIIIIITLLLSSSLF